MAADLALNPSAVQAFGPDDASRYVLGVKHSLSGRAWRLADADRDVVRALELSGHGAALARLLAVRGVTAQTAEAFLEPRLKSLLPEPNLFAGMERAAARMAQAIKAGESIAVFGDYDVDGACSSALLLRFLRALKIEPILYIPGRMTEGYGPSPAAMRLLREKGASLVVTVDCGAAAYEALDAAADLKLDVIVLDHHQVERNPAAFAHVNPNGPDDSSGFTYICAAGLVFIFLVAVQRTLKRQGWFTDAGIAAMDLISLLDLVALATVADVVPLKGVNRAFVRQGLKVLERLEHRGLAALAALAAAKPPFTAYHLGFIFGPRINAGGRVGRCDLGARLLAGDDEAQAARLAQELDMHNRERQAIEAIILETAEAMALAGQDEAFLLLEGEGWHAGVVGIVAGRLKERHGKPVLVAGFEDAGADAMGRGSARSVAGVDLGAVIRAAKEAGLLESGGGHAMAAGFTLKRAGLPTFRAFLETRLGPQRAVIESAGDLAIDALVSASGANLDLIADLERASPFGAGNPEPLFVLPDMAVAYAGVVGADHLKLRLVGRDGSDIGAIAFRAASSSLGQRLLKARGQRVHVAGRLKRDDYGGTPKVQLHLTDAAPAGA